MKKARSGFPERAFFRLLVLGLSLVRNFSGFHHCCFRGGLGQLCPSRLGLTLWSEVTEVKVADVVSVSVVGVRTEGLTLLFGDLATFGGLLH